MSDEVYSATILGTLAGVLSAFVVYVLVIIYREVVLPRIETMIYKGIYLNGQWKQDKAYDEDVDESSGMERDHDVFIMSLTQNGNRITGEFTLLFHREGQSSAGTYSVRGEVIDGYLVATMKTTNRQQSSQAAGLFKVVANGTTLMGVLVYKAARHNNVERIELELNRAQD